MYNEPIMRGILILLLILSFAAKPGECQQGETAMPYEAEEEYSQTGATLSSRENEFQYIRAEIARLLKENKQLEAEYAALKEQLDGLKDVVKDKEHEVEKIAPRDWEEKRSRERQINSIKALYQDAEKLKNDLVVKKSRNAYLSGQLLDLEEKQRLWKLKLSDLEFLKREVELDIKMMEYELTERRQSKEQEVNDLRSKIQKNMEKERELLNRISAIEDGSYYSPSKAARMEEENDQLEITMRAYQHEVAFKEREIDILDKKRVLAAKSTGYVMNKKLEERNQLRKDVEILKSRAEQLNVVLESSLEQKIKRESVLQDFVHMQQENDTLRTQLSELERTLNSSSR